MSLFVAGTVWGRRDEGCSVGQNQTHPFILVHLSGLYIILRGLHWCTSFKLMGFNFTHTHATFHYFCLVYTCTLHSIGVSQIKSKNCFCNKNYSNIFIVFFYIYIVKIKLSLIQKTVCVMKHVCLQRTLPFIYLLRHMILSSSELFFTNVTTFCKKTKVTLNMT